MIHERAITVAEARERVKAEPKRFRAAVIEGLIPLRDTDENEAVLFRLKKTAEECFKERVSELDKTRKRKFGNLGAGVVLYDDGLCVGIDRGR